MATLIEIRNNNGLVGRCDAKCYEAFKPECDCVCEGHNHGVGLTQAQANTEAITKRVIKKYSKEEVIFSDKGKQLELFNA
jgi:hypothetical protein